MSDARDDGPQTGLVRALWPMTQDTQRGSAVDTINRLCDEIDRLLAVLPPNGCPPCQKPFDGWSSAPPTFTLDWEADEPVEVTPPAEVGGDTPGEQVRERTDEERLAALNALRAAEGNAPLACLPPDSSWADAEHVSFPVGGEPEVTPPAEPPEPRWDIDADGHGLPPRIARVPSFKVLWECPTCGSTDPEVRKFVHDDRSASIQALRLCFDPWHGGAS